MSTFQVKYPASLGRFSAVASSGNAPEGTEAATYGESVRYGRDVATLEMATVSRHCPGTRFILIGYSQGAHLVGDAAAEVAAGRVRGVTADDIAAVLLFADPARAPLGEGASQRPSRLYADAPKGVRGRNGETVQTGGTSLNPAYEGLAGARTSPFTALEGKVLSLCNGADMACATDPVSPLRTLADVAMRDVTPGPFNAVTGIRVTRFRELRAQGLPVRDAFEQSGLSLIDATLIPQILIELATAGSALGQHAARTSTTPPADQAAIALLAALPELAKEGVTWPWLFQALDPMRDQAAQLLDDDTTAWLDLTLEVFRTIQAVERLSWQLERLGVIPRTPTGTEGRQAWAHGAVSALSGRVLDATGLRAAYEDPQNAVLVSSAQRAGDFGPRHMSYYKLGYTDIPGGFKVDGLTGYDYALGWLGRVVRGVVEK